MELKLFPLLVLLLLGVSCSKPSTRTVLNVTTAAAFGSSSVQAVARGGLMVWGVSSKGYRFSRLLNDTNSISVELPNDSWIFSSVAWDNVSNTQMHATTLRCARSAAVALKGTAVSMPLQLLNGNCNSPHFIGSSSSVVTDTELRFCKSTTDVDGRTKTCSLDPLAVGRVADKAAVASVKLRLEEYDLLKDGYKSQGTGLTRCVPMTAGLDGEWSVPGDLTVPVGDPAAPASSPYRMSLELYWGSSDCGTTGTTESNTIALPNGLISGGEHKYYPDSTNQTLYVQVPDDLACKGRTATTWGGGLGTANFPYLICSAEQLYNIFDSGAYLNYSFRLMSDIDLNPYSKGIATAANLAVMPTVECWEEGQNWQPFGITYSAAPSCSVGSSAFSGNFFGGDHTIKGARARVKAERVGFISDWSPATQSYLAGIKLENAEFEGYARVGAIVGRKANVGARGLVANITVTGGTISSGNSGGAADLGGVIGSVSYLDMYNIKTSRVKVEGEGYNIGGIFGYAAEAQTMKRLVSRSYVGAPDWANAVSLGGIGGYYQHTTGAATFGEWASESIVAGGSNIGGLLGTWTGANQTLQDVYANGTLVGRGMSPDNVGGFFGQLSGTNPSTTILNRAHFSGSLQIISDAVNCGGICNIGWIAGMSFDLNASNIYVMNDLVAGNSAIEPRSGWGDDPDSDGTRWTVTELANNSSGAGMLLASNTSLLTGAAWVRQNGDIPRLAFEAHPCSLPADANGISPRTPLATQNNYWGSATKPLFICNRDQFMEIDQEVLAGHSAAILGAINLSSSSVHVKQDLNTGAYLTGEYGFIHGLRRVETPGSAFSWSPFYSIAGTLKHLIIAGFNLNAGGAPSTSYINGLAETVDGTVDDVKVLASFFKNANSYINVSGLATYNNGEIRNAEVNSTLRGNGALFGMVFMNNTSGKITDSETRGLLVANATGSLYFAGIAGSNQGTIKRVTVGSKLVAETNQPHSVSQASFGVLYNDGSMSDIYVSGEAMWEMLYSDSNVAQLAVTNTSSGVIQRSLVKGHLHDRSSGPSFVDNSFDIVKTNSGSLNSVFAEPAGRYIQRISSGHTCSGSTLTLLSPTLPSAFIASGSYWGISMASNAKVVWAMFDNGNGVVKYTRITDAGYTSPNLDLTLSDPCTSLNYGAGMSITLLQDYNSTLALAVGNLLGSPYVGFTNGTDPYLNLVGPLWGENLAGAPVSNTVIASGTSGMDWMLTVMGEYLVNGSNTTPAPIWEKSGTDEIELFRFKK